MGSKDNREIGSRSALVNREHMAMILPAILVTSLVQSSKLAGHSKCIFSFFFFFSFYLQNPKYSPSSLCHHQ